MKKFLERAKDSVFNQHELHIILDALPMPLSWATVPDGRIQFVNRAFLATFGYPEGRFDTVDDWIDSAYPREKHRNEARRRWQSLWQANAAGLSTIEPYEIEVRCADGSIKTVHHRGILLYEIGVGIAIFDDVTDRRRALQALRRFALEDPLTGLANRRMLQERWQQIAASAGADPIGSALLLLDLDGFKSINDRLGHNAGDQTLIVVAERLKQSVREGDLVCRIGGDEFAILLANVDTPDIVEKICWRIEASMKPPVKGLGQTITVKASIGVSLFPQDGHDLQQLMGQADDALYRCKAERKGGWMWFMEPRAA